jgi:hypothetical protein
MEQWILQQRPHAEVVVRQLEDANAGLGPRDEVERRHQRYLSLPEEIAGIADPSAPGHGELLGNETIVTSQNMAAASSHIAYPKI